MERDDTLGLFTVVISGQLGLWWGELSLSKLISAVMFEFCIIWVIRKIHNKVQGDSPLSLSEGCLVVHKARHIKRILVF